MDLKVRLVEPPEPNLRVGLRCFYCGTWRLFTINLDRFVPKGVPGIPNLDLWKRARSDLSKITGEAHSFPGVFYCGREECDGPGPEGTESVGEGRGSGPGGGGGGTVRSLQEQGERVPEQRER